MAIEVQVSAGPTIVLDVNAVVDTGGTAYGSAVYGGFAAPSVFVFNESGSQSGNRYNDWESLVAALSLAPEGRKDIYIESSFTMPAGAWNLRDATLHGAGVFGTGAGGVVVTIPTGVTLSNGNRLFAEGGIVLHSTSTSSVYTISAADSVYLESDAVICSKSAAFFNVTATTGQVLFSMRYGSGFVLPSTLGYVDGDYESVNISAAGALVVAAQPAGVTWFDDNTFRGVADSFLVIAIQSAAGGLNPSTLVTTGRTHTNVLGTVYPILFCRAAQVGYTPTTSGDWPVEPTDTHDALDKLAARLNALEP